MLIFIEAIIVLAVLYYLYKLVFKGTKNYLGISKPLALAVLIVGALVLPSTIQAMIVVILIVAFLVGDILRKEFYQINLK